jgi:pyruvate dehydrogenase E2 component (dihydrolipoamide acetyltransferase)
MPQLGADMEAGTLVEWLKQPGARVQRGDIVAVVDTQKGAIEIEVFEDGVLREIRVQPGEQVPVGTVLAVIDGAAGPAGAATVAAAPPIPTTPISGSTPPGETRRRISPAAREAARALRVDLTDLKGTGPGGAVIVADIERAAAAAQTERAAPGAPGDRVTAMRSAIAAAMTRSKREIPHFYLASDIDLTAAMTWLGAENARRSVTERLLPIVVMLKAVAHGLREVPELNGFWVDGRFEPGTGIHIGCAVVLRGGGLVAPALHDVDRKTLAALAAELRDLVTRARGGSLRSSELSDPTITVTNLGELGADATFGVIFPPQVAIVGFGRIGSRPRVVDDTVVARTIVTTTLSADHRAIDGHRGARFLAALERRLQQPEAL